MDADTAERTRPIVCRECGRRARFITPLGVHCQVHALLVAAERGWVPAQLRKRPMLAGEPGSDDS